MAMLRSESYHVEMAKARASFYAFINIYFWELPDEQFVSTLREEAFGSVLVELEQSHEVHGEITAGALLMRAYLDDTRALDHGELAKRLGLDRTRLYRGVSPHYGPTPPYEALWIKQVSDSDLLHEMAQIYRENGFTLKGDICERLDYIGIQLNFMERLVMKEIAAWQARDDRMVQAALRYENKFIRDHVGAWIPGFVSSALEYAQTDFYKGHLQMLKGFVEQEKEVLGRISVSSLIPEVG